jgi:hypothetical protein
MIPDKGTGAAPDSTNAEGGRHAAEAYMGPAIDLTVTPHRRAAVEAAAEAEVAS